MRWICLPEPSAEGLLHRFHFGAEIEVCGQAILDGPTRMDDSAVVPMKGLADLHQGGAGEASAEPAEQMSRPSDMDMLIPTDQLGLDQAEMGADASGDLPEMPMIFPSAQDEKFSLHFLHFSFQLQQAPKLFSAGLASGEAGVQLILPTNPPAYLLTILHVGGWVGR